MLIKIFENTFFGGDSRLQCVKYQEKNELLFQKYSSKKRYIAVQAGFQQRFSQAPPFKKIIQLNVTKCRLHETSLNRNKENSGRRRTARSEDNIELIKYIIKQPKCDTNMY